MENNLVFPILGKDNKFPFVLMDLSQLYIPPSTPTIVMNHQLSEYVENFRGQQEGIPYGGFFEKRFIYLSSTHFGTDQNRDIHLGIDLWLDPYTPIFASKDGIVHSVAYNAAELDYGWCVIIQYGQNEFVLYGHMASDLLKDYRSGDVITQGMIIGYTGDYAENGGWYPHLHLQVMNTMLDYHGDFIGVCNEGDIPYYSEIVKNPVYLIL